jgi:RimJ/RimL family protein N-acetyltransferase
MTILDTEASPPLGEVVDSHPAKRPQAIRITGRVVSLLALDAEAHARPLYEQTHATDSDGLWRYMSEGPFPSYSAFHAQLIRKAQSQDPLFFTILENSRGQPVGLVALLRIEPAHRCIEVGSIVYTPALQRTVGATEAMYLLARYVFEELGYRRYEWKCNALNEASRRAALRLGFRFEGIFRQHMIIKGRSRDTAWFSMLDSEWPKRKANLERWLAPSNFDGSGKQNISLSELNSTGSPNGPQ